MHIPYKLRTHSTEYEGIYMEYGWEMHGILWNMHGICMEYVWKMYGMLCNMHGMCIEYVWKMHEYH